MISIKFVIYRYIHKYIIVTIYLAHNTTGRNVKRVLTTTVQRRGAICIIVNSADGVENECSNQTNESSDNDSDSPSEYDDDEDEDDDEEIDMEKMNSQQNQILDDFDVSKRAKKKTKWKTKVKTKSIEILSPVERSNTQSTSQSNGNSNSSNGVYARTTKLKIWYNPFTITQKKKRRKSRRKSKTRNSKRGKSKAKYHKATTISNNNGTMATKFICFFRRSSRDSQHKVGEG